MQGRRQTLQCLWTVHLVLCSWCLPGAALSALLLDSMEFSSEQTATAKQGCGMLWPFRQKQPLSLKPQAVWFRVALWRSVGPLSHNMFRQPTGPWKAWWQLPGPIAEALSVGICFAWVRCRNEMPSAVATTPHFRAWRGFQSIQRDTPTMTCFPGLPRLFQGKNEKKNTRIQNAHPFFTVCKRLSKLLCFPILASGCLRPLITGHWDVLCPSTGT